MKKSILSIALVLCMVLALLPAGVSAAEIVDSGNCGANPPTEPPGPFYDTLTWTLDSDGLLTISGKGETYDHSFAYGRSPFANNASIRRVVIEPGMTKLGDEMFVRCSNLTKVTIPATVQEIGDNVFCDCTSLKEIEVAKDNKNYVSVDGVLFNKDQTELLAFPAGKTGAYTVPEPVEEIVMRALYRSQVSELHLGSKVTRISYEALWGMSNLKHLQLPASVESLGSFALDCGSLESVAYEDGAPIWIRIEGSMKTAYAPNSVEDISIYFDHDEGTQLKDIYFGGTKAEWDAKLLNSSDDDLNALKKINIHYNHKHDFGKMTVVTPATEDHEGLKTGTCVCSLWKSEVIPKLEPADPTPASPKPDDTKPVENPFTDVNSGDYFYDPVLWALTHEPQITDGMTETTFAPGETCTRGQVVTFLWRAMGCTEPTKTDNPFSDVSSGDYFYKAVLWAVEKGITDGTSATTFSPNDGCTRGQVVTFLHRANGLPTVKTSSNPFLDVTQGAYYYDAVLWAVEQGITDGTSDTTFSPDATCTRGQIVTFLYRGSSK